MSFILPMQGWSDFAVLVTDRHVKFEVLERFTKPWLSSSPFQ